MTEDRPPQEGTLVFAIARRKTNTQLAKNELNQSLEHLMRAATFAARSTGATMGPMVNTARDRVSPAAGIVRDAANNGWGSTLAVLAPLAAAATDSARKASKANQRGMKAMDKKAQKLDRKAMKQESGRRGSKMTTLLIAGAAIGAVGAMVMGRRKQQQWDEYDPSRPVGGASTEERMAPGATGMVEDLTPPDTSITVTDAGNQTTSAMHSPTVAGMADGSIAGAEASTRHTSI